jgi:hypothetical protein
VRDIREAMILGYLGSPGLRLLCFDLNGNPTDITNQVVMMVFRAVSKQAFPCINKGIS